MLYLDSDILVSPSSPNLFEIVPSDCLGATVIDHLPPEVAPAVANGWITNDIHQTQKQFGDVNWKKEYFNSGSMLFSKEHISIFESALKVAKQWHEFPTERTITEFRVFADQSVFNYFAKATGAKIYDIGYSYNHTPAFNTFNHRYLSHFYHYARLRPHRRGNRIRQMNLDFWVLNHPKLHKFLTNNIWFTKIFDKL